MKARTSMIALMTAALAVAGTQLVDAEPGANDAEAVRDEAISRVVAWRPKSGEAVLLKNQDLDKSQEWLTAEALLMATYGIGQDDALVKKGLDILTAQAKKAPEDPVAEYYRGVVLAWADQRQEATTAWKGSKQRAEALVDKDSKDARAQFYLGASLVKLNQPAAARKALKKAEKAGWEKPMVDFQTGLSYMLEENWKAAKRSFDEVDELDPRYAHLYFYRALAADKLGQKDQLFNDLDQFVKLAPNSLEAKTARAILSSMR